MIPLRFVHFTDSSTALASIVQNGLFIRNRRRNVWKYFTRRKEFREREPQQFGMTCVHTFRFFPNRRYVKRFGPYGIELTQEWIQRNDFRRVLYISENDLYRLGFQAKFDEAISELDECVRKAPSDDSFPRMAYTNARVACLYGARLWCQFLEWFQFMEPKKHRYQSEWRYSREDPFYQSHSTGELNDALKTKKGWLHIVHVLKLDRSDIVRLYVPKIERESFTELLPDGFENIKIKYT